MTKSPPKTRIKFYSGWRAFPIRLKFRTSLGKYIFQKKKYPLFILKSSKGGLVKTYKTQKELKLRKIINFNNHYYFSLTTPHWPSKPFDQMAANGGLNITAAGTRFKQQIDIAILAITRKCNYDCKHCYEYFNLAEEDIVPIECWKEVIKELQKIGVSIITFSGGEPMLRSNGLIELLEYSDKNQSDLHIHTSGHGVSPKKALELKNAGLNAAGVALDDFNPERHDTLRGYKGSYKEALQAIKCFQDAGIFTYINTCLTKELIRAGDLMNYLELTKNLNVGVVRLLEPKTCGGYLFENKDNLFSEDDRKTVTEFFIQANQGKKYKDYPLVSYEAYFEDPKKMGCMMGGHSHFYIDSLGNVEPCVFLPVSFGNIMKEDFSTIFRKMRKAVPQPLHMQCPAIFLSETIQSKKKQGMVFPIPFRKIEKEWQEMSERV